MSKIKQPNYGKTSEQELRLSDCSPEIQGFGNLPSSRNYGANNTVCDAL